MKIVVSFIQISLKFVPDDLVDNKSVLIPIIWINKYIPSNL